MSDNVIKWMIIGFIALFIWAIVEGITKRKQLKKYERINVGMDEGTMLSIMGKGYNKSSLKNDRIKYEWRINASSYGHNGFRTYTGVKKVAIYVKNGFVEEIKPYNVS